MLFKYIPLPAVFLDSCDKFKPISLNNAILNQGAAFVTLSNYFELKAVLLFDLKAAVEPGTTERAASQRMDPSTSQRRAGSGTNKYNNKGCIT